MGKLICHNCNRFQKVEVKEEERTYKVIDTYITGIALITYCLVCKKRSLQ